MRDFIKNKTATDGNKKSEFHGQCLQSEKAVWVRAARRDNLKLTAWIVKTLNEKVKFLGE